VLVIGAFRAGTKLTMLAPGNIELKVCVAFAEM
jgi:hypothetical protein